MYKVSAAAQELAAEMWNVARVDVAHEIANRHIKKAQVAVLEILDRLIASHETEKAPTRRAIKIMRDALSRGDEIAEPILGFPLALSDDVKDEA